IPSEPTFCRVFAEFAQDQLPQQIHEQMVKIHVGTKLVGHVSRDATAIEAPERPAAKPAPAVPATPRQRGPAQARRSPSARTAQTPGTPAGAVAGRKPGGLACPL
ncbi:MAG TPA: IS5/IS1182 family transposase, partial [Verrucomicrobiae bacterium]